MANALKNFVQLWKRRKFNIMDTTENQNAHHYSMIDDTEDRENRHRVTGVV